MEVDTTDLDQDGNGKISVHEMVALIAVMLVGVAFVVVVTADTLVQLYASHFKSFVVRDWEITSFVAAAGVSTLLTTTAKKKS